MKRLKDIVGKKQVKMDIIYRNKLIDNGIYTIDINKNRKYKRYIKSTKVEI